MAAGLTKKLVKIGNSLGVILNKSILDLLKITPETTLDVTTDGKSLTLTPQKDKGGK